MSSGNTTNKRRSNISQRIFVILFLITALSALGVVIFHSFQKPNSIPDFTSSPTFPITTQAAPDTTVMESSDGSQTLTMKEEKSINGTVTYTFSVSGQVIYTKTLEKGESFIIPFNTWSPDNKYVFLKEITKTGVSYIVINGKGGPITKEDQTVDFADLFAKKLPAYKIADVTGWAGPTLIVINTNKDDENAGPSFWFDVASLLFIQLSNRFN